MKENTAKTSDLSAHEHPDKMEALETRFSEFEKEFESLKKAVSQDKVSIIVFSGELDKALAALVIATGAAAMDMEVVMFFTFWGTPILRDRGKKAGGKDMMGKMFEKMLPKGTGGVKLSRMNMGGMGTAMMKSLMKKKNVPSLDEMIEMAGELGVKIVICEMSMELMGFKREEMIEYPHLSYAGVATFLDEAADSRIQLFI